MCGARFDMHGDDVGAGLGEGFEIRIARRDHQMHIERLLGVRAGGFDDVRADGKYFGTRWPSMTSTWIQSAPA